MNKGELLAGLAASVVALIAITGWYLLFGKEVRNFMEDVKEKLLRSRWGTAKEGPVEQRVRQALVTVFGKPINPLFFFTLDGAIFTVIMFTGIRSLSMLMSLSMALAGAALPFLLLFLRLESIRRRGSHEGEALVAEFLRQYRIAGENIYETLEQVVNSSGKTKVSRKLLFRLLLELRNTGDPEKIRRSTEDFAYGMNTNWSRMLAHNICMAAASGIDISLAVEDILIQLRDARALAEERKRMNSESARMTIFMVPFTYLATVAMSVRYLDTPLSGFLKNQFGTGQGLLLFLMILFLFIVNLAVITLITNQKFDF